MTDEQYATFVKDHRDDIVEKIKELDNFDDTSLSFYKTQVIQAINIRKKMPVVPIAEIRNLLVGYIAIRFIEDELGERY